MVDEADTKTVICTNEDCKYNSSCICTADVIWISKTGNCRTFKTKENNNE